MNRDERGWPSKFTDFILETNLFISSAALLMTMETQVQLGMAPQWHPYLFIIFFATMFEYNFHRLVTITIRREALQNEKNTWVRNNLLLFYCMAVFSVIGFVTAILMAKAEVLYVLAPIAAITVLYSFPLFRKRNFIFRLREIPLLKIFLIAFVWSAVTILLPVIHSEKAFGDSDVILMFAERFVFIFAITIPFDIRDMAVDRLSGVRTIPLMIGDVRALKVAVASVMCFILLTTLHYNSKSEYFLSVAFLVSGLSTLFFLLNKALRGHRNYYYGVLDGTAVLQGLLVMGCYFLFRK